MRLEVCTPLEYVFPTPVSNKEMQVTTDVCDWSERQDCAMLLHCIFCSILLTLNPRHV
jgi:hypothetical protein